MEIPSILKYTFWFHAIVTIVLGIWYFIAPDTWVTLVSWPDYDPSVDRVMAALMLGLGIASVLGARADVYDKVAILVIADIIGCLLGAIGLTWYMVTEAAAPLIGWALVGILAVWFILFFYSYWITRE
jgi:hypothetical protein